MRIMFFGTSVQSTVAHLRIPFSIYLMPVFWFAAATLDAPVPNALLSLFLLLHLLVYPSSNAYNSLMDRDMGSIGGLKTPPPIPKNLGLVCGIMDVLAILWALIFFASPWIAVGVGLYILASRAYSNRNIRIKKYAILSYLHVIFFQGCLIFALVHLANNAVDEPSIGLPSSPLLWSISALLIGAAYPLTQVYQHESDRQDGVKTLSMLLGIRGSFVFSGTLLAAMSFLFYLYLMAIKAPFYLYIGMLISFIPVLIFFIVWTQKVFRDSKFADFEHTMRMNNIGSISVNCFLIILNIHQHLL